MKHFAVGLVIASFAVQPMAAFGEIDEPIQQDPSIITDQIRPGMDPAVAHVRHIETLRATRGSVVSAVPVPAPNPNTFVGPAVPVPTPPVNPSSVTSATPVPAPNPNTFVGPAVPVPTPPSPNSLSGGVTVVNPPVPPNSLSGGVTVVNPPQSGLPQSGASAIPIIPKPTPPIGVSGLDGSQPQMSESDPLQYR